MLILVSVVFLHRDTRIFLLLDLNTAGCVVQVVKVQGHSVEVAIIEFFYKFDDV